MTSRPKFETGSVYHVYNRGADKRDIFSDDVDRSRLAFDLYEFNDVAPTRNLGRYYKINDRGPTSIIEERSREKLVDILAWVFMSNHYHLLLRQRIDGGISQFMQKLGTGYTRYFNDRHERSGVLFQGKFKAKYIPEDATLMYLVAYIHLNPLGLSIRRRRASSSHNTLSQHLKRLRDYRWSSYPAYLGDDDALAAILESSAIGQMGIQRKGRHERDVAAWISLYAEFAQRRVGDLGIEQID